MPQSGSVLDVCGVVRNQTSRVTNWASTATMTTATDPVFGLAETIVSASASYRPGSSWTGRLEQPDPRNVDASHFEDQIVVGAGTYTAAGTTAASVTESSVVVAFKVH